jgi:hypothetical protein
MDDHLHLNFLFIMIAVCLFVKLQKTTYYYKNDNINMDSTITGSMNDNINMDSTITGSMNDNINMNRFYLHS